MTGRITDSAPRISTLLDNFVMTMRSLERSLLLAMRELSRMHSLAHKKLDEFVDSGACETVETNGRRGIRPKSHDHCEEFGKLTKNVDQMHIAGDVVPRGFLILLVSHYDAFIRSLFRAILLKSPAILKSSHTQLEVSDLLMFESIDEAYEWLVERQVDQVMRGSHSDQFDFIETVLKIKWTRNEEPLVAKVHRGHGAS